MIERSDLPEDPLDDLPELDGSPIMVAAFEGWNDAAESATAALDHLANLWDAQPLAAIDPDDYYDFQVNRPRITGVDDERRLIWPTTRILLARPPAAPRDIVLVRGIEPNLRWRQFCAEILTLAGQLGVDVAFMLGALLADNPHTRPIPVTATTSDPDLADAYDLMPPTYEGPSGIVGALTEACAETDLPAISVWAAVPHYVAQPPCPKATVELLTRLGSLLEVEIPLGELPDEAEAWERGVDDLARDDSEVSDYVRSLEQASDAVELPEATGDEIAAELERYLRHRPPDTK